MSLVELHGDEATTDFPRPPQGSGWELVAKGEGVWHWKRKPEGEARAEVLLEKAEKWRARGLGLTEAVEDLGDLATRGPRRELSQAAYAEALAYVLVHLEWLERSKP